MRISLRELMIVVTVAAVGLTGLKFASTWMLSVVQAMAGMFLLAFLVRAIVDRGTRQAFAIGFVACAIMYLVSLAISEQNTWKSPVGGFGTGALDYRLHSLVVSPQWVNTNTDEIERNLQPTPAELNARQAVRIELKPLPPETAVRSAGDSTVATDDADAGATLASQHGGRTRGRGGGRGGRGGGFAEFGGGPSAGVQLTPQQNVEYTTADNYRRNYYDETGDSAGPGRRG